MPPEFPSRRPLLASAVFGGLWIALCTHLAGQWSADEQYSYGWLVPPLALYLGWRRWDERPAPVAASRRGSIIILAAAFAFLPAWLIARTSPDWRLLTWLLAGDVTCLLVGVVAMLGGTRWVRHFAVPVCFLLTAVPWPSAVEAPVIGGLMRSVAATTVTVLNAFGTLAVQQGNLIETRAGLLGIDEACSGVRSLQATLMMALFFGEFYRFSWPRRAALLAAGVGIAFTTNVGRAFLLAWTASREGLSAVARWHDPAGFSIAVICFLLLAALAAWLARRAGAPAVVGTALPASIPPRFTLCLGGWFLVVFTATELWLHPAPPSKRVAPSWGFDWPPPGTPKFHQVPLEARTADLLRADEARGGEWLDPSGGRWLLYHFRWAAGPSRAHTLARIHRPEICLPSAGWNLVEDRGLVTVATGREALPFRALRFMANGATAHVWFCRWEDRAPGQASAPLQFDSTQLASLRAVLRRGQSPGQQVLEAILFSPLDGEEADSAFRQQIAARIQSVKPD